MTPGTGSALNYSFDASSNLTSLPLGATATYDNAGELTSAALAGVTTNYTYNADGERLTAKNGSTTIASGTWNGAEQLTAYSDSTANTGSATYDGNGLRASATTTPSGGSATTQNFAWNTTTPVPQLLMDSANAYVYGSSGTPAEQVNLATGAVTYLIHDSLGSVRGIVSSSGALTASTAYDAWGNPNSAGGLSSYTPFGYAGGYTDSTGLLYLVNRYYDPATGQFPSVDPLVSSTHQPYSYGGGNPVSNTDPHGTSACGVTNFGGWFKWVPGGLFGGCVYGQGLYVWGMSAGFVAWRIVCGWHYYWTAYWWGHLRNSWWAPYHSGCDWNNNGNYHYWWYTAYWYAHAGPFDAQLWATNPWGRQYRLALISEWVS
jgi:RHS repeat-associated protein